MPSDSVHGIFPRPPFDGLLLAQEGLVYSSFQRASLELAVGIYSSRFDVLTSSLVSLGSSILPNFED